MSDDDEDKIGYGRPPKHTRFKPGQSGNPKGRPKGSRNFQTDLLKILGRMVLVKDRDGSRMVRAQEAAILRLCEKALNGDLRSLNLLLGFAHRYNDEALVQDAENGLPEDDREILDRYNARQRERDAVRGNGDQTEPETDQSDMPGSGVDE